MPRWNNNRLVSAIRLLAFLPTEPMSISTRAKIRAELGINQDALRRLIDAIDESGVAICFSYLPDGEPSYFIGKQSQKFVDRIMRVVQ